MRSQRYNVLSLQRSNTDGQSQVSEETLQTPADRSHFSFTKRIEHRTPGLLHFPFKIARKFRAPQLQDKQLQIHQLALAVEEALPNDSMVGALLLGEPGQNVVQRVENRYQTSDFSQVGGDIFSTSMYRLEV